MSEEQASSSNPVQPNEPSVPRRTRATAVHRQAPNPNEIFLEKGSSLDSKQQVSLESDKISLNSTQSRGSLRTDIWSNWECSRSSLHEFRSSKSQRFRINKEGMTQIDAPMNGSVPEVGKRGREISRQKVYARKVNAKEHGMDDWIVEKIVGCQNVEDRRSALQEVNNLKTIHHSHFIAFLGTWTWGLFMGILMFPLAKCDLAKFMTEPGIEQRRHLMLPWFSCLTSALNFLHEKNFKHRDIKPENILIDCKYSILFTDLGCSKQYANRDQSVTNSDAPFTESYASPSVINGEPHGLESDIFSLGCVFLEMATVFLRSSHDDRPLMSMSKSLGQGTVCHWHRVYLEKRHTIWIQFLKDEYNRQITGASERPGNIANNEKEMASNCLDMISTMISESVQDRKLLSSGKSKDDCPTLDQIYKTFKKLSPEECKSCTSKIVPSPRASLASMSSLSLTSDLAIRQHDNLINPGSQPVTHAGNMSKDSKDMPPKDLEVTDNAEENPVAFITASTRPILSNGNPLGSPPIGSEALGSNDFLPLNPLNDANMNEEEIQPESPAQVTTELASVSQSNIKSIERQPTGNSQIRLGNRRRVLTLRNIKEVPGRKIVYFDEKKNRYLSAPISAFDWSPIGPSNPSAVIKVIDGVLISLPKGIGRTWRNPRGDINLIKILPFSLTWERMFRRSTRTMYIPGRFSRGQLEAGLTKREAAWTSLGTDMLK